MSHYKPYPAYKDSGVEWLGRVPEHWYVVRMRYAATLNPPVRRDLLDDPDQEVSFLPMEAIGEDGSLNLEQNRPVADVRNGYSYFEDGDVAFAKVTPCFENGKGALMRGLRCAAGFGTTELTVLRPNLAVADARYINYIVQGSSFRAFGAGAMTGAGGLKRVPDEFTRNFPVLLPELGEQRVIASRLDRETARIDALIEKKTRFIELLREKTLSLIGKAFECEESRWIRLQHLCDVVSRPVGHEEEKSYVRLGLYNRGRGIFKKEETDAEDMGDSDFFWVESGDLILSGQFAWEGAVALADVEHESCVVSHRYPVIRGRTGEVLTEYLFAFFLSHYGDFLLNDCSRGSAGRNRPLNIASLLKWKIPVPPLELQEKVASLVRYRRELLQKVEASTNLLKERRSALITAAVTGQIDLREAV